MIIDLSMPAIHAAVLKAHPEIDPARSSCHLDCSTGDAYAWVTDWTNVRDCIPLTMDRNDERFDYQGIKIGIFRYAEHLTAANSEEKP